MQKEKRMGTTVQIKEEIRAEIQKMLVVNQEDLESDIVANVLNQTNFTTLVYEINDKISILESQRKKLKKKLLMEYITSNTPEKEVNQLKFSRSEIDGLINIDDRMIDLDFKISEYTNVLNYYENILKILSQKSFNVSTIVKLKKFLHGDMN